MKYWYDWEFEEHGKTIIPISLGMVSEDNRELYLINKEYMMSYAYQEGYHWRGEPSMLTDWLCKNVIDKIPQNDVDTYGVNYDDWGPIVLNFISDKNRYLNREDIELWGHFVSYDHVALAQIFGPMVNLPKPIPMWSHDDMQIRNGQHSPLRDPAIYPEHHALHDAKFQKYQYECWTSSATISNLGGVFDG